MKPKPYKSYKPSGVEWLGEVPEHWVTHKMSRGFGKIGSGTTPKSDSSDYYDGEIPWATTSELRETLILETKQKVTREAIFDYPTLKIYPVNTILFAMYGATIGRLGILGIPSTVNQACCAFSVPIHFESKFIFYWLLMAKPVLLSMSTGGGQPNLSQDDLKQLQIPTPPLLEQQTIANFLDAKITMLDTLIAKKRLLLEKLREQRTALISRTVTKGLPQAEAKAAGVQVVSSYKPSGVEWLGEVPTHWEVKEMKYVCSTSTGFAFDSDDYIPEGIPLIRIGDLLPNGKVDLENAKKLPDNFLSIFSEYKVVKDDLLLAMTGATIGKVSRYSSNEYGLLNQRVCKLLPLYINRNFLWFILNSSGYQEYIRLTGFGGAQPNISDS